MIVGNGNVVSDVARILTVDPATLADTDIAPYALKALRESKIEEVVILGRRGPAESAFTVLEFVGLLAADIDIAIDGELPEVTAELPYKVEQKLRLLHSVARRPFGERKRIVFRYLSSPVEILGTDTVTGVRVERNELVTDAEGRTSAVATGDGRICWKRSPPVGYRGCRPRICRSTTLAASSRTSRAGAGPRPGVEVVAGTYVTG